MADADDDDEPDDGVDDGLLGRVLPSFVAHAQNQHDARDHDGRNGEQTGEIDEKQQDFQDAVAQISRQGRAIDTLEEFDDDIGQSDDDDTDRRVENDLACGFLGGFTAES